MRAEAGPHQADVVYSRHDGPPPWVGLLPTIHLDEKDRPVVGAQDHKTGWHHLVLEKGKWTEEVKITTSPANNQTAKQKDEENDTPQPNADVTKLALPYVPHHPNPEYLQETGNLVYTVFPEKDRFHGDKPKHHRILLVLSKPVKAKGA